MPKVKLLKGAHNCWRNGKRVRYKKGDIFEVPQHELKAIKDRCEIITGVSDGKRSSAKLEEGSSASTE